MSKYVVAIEQGTTSTRCVIFDHNGRVISSAEKEHRQIYLHAGRVEHRPLEIWKNTEAVIRSALAQANIQRGDSGAVGVATQRETTIVWDRRTGQPYGNAIVWQDARNKNICDDLASSGGRDRFRSQVGLPLATYFSGPKIKWILGNVPGVRIAAERDEAVFGNVDTWEIWWLTGGPKGGAHVTDVTNASRTMLMNLKTLDWDDELLRIFDIPRQMLPRIVPSSDPQTWGATSRNGPFGDCIPVCGDLGDQQASLVGQACFGVGEVKNTYSTGCFMLLNTGTEPVHSKSGLLTTVAYKFGSQPAVYALEGAIAMTGALVRWLRDNLGIINSAPEIERLALSVKDNGGIYFVPPISDFYAPYWGSDARCMISGITGDVNKGHIARAVLEAIAYQTRKVLETMEKDAQIEIETLKVDGAMVHNDLLMQFQTDILGLPLVRPKISEMAALGAAYAAGLATGFWSAWNPDCSSNDLPANLWTDKFWYPQIGAAIREDLYQSWLIAIETAPNRSM
ncbi:MAG: glycerol kinase GlpK [Chloroflexi bacterium]|nr:glycerol kinase GlpK [Chloroflexota bacterium]